MTTELTDSGNRIVVTNRAATSTLVTFPASSVFVSTRGTTCGTCAKATLPPREKSKNQAPHKLFIVSTSRSRNSAIGRNRTESFVLQRAVNSRHATDVLKNFAGGVCESP